MNESLYKLLENEVGRDKDSFGHKERRRLCEKYFPLKGRKKSGLVE